MHIHRLSRHRRQLRSTPLGRTRARDVERKSAAATDWRSAAFDAMTDAILIADDDRRYVDANPSAGELLGVPPFALTGKRIDDFAPPPADYDTAEAWNDFLRHGEERGNFPLVRPDGALATVEYVSKAHLVPGKHLAILRDVTESVKTSQRLAEAATRAERLQAIVSSLVEAISVREIFDLVVRHGVEHLGVRCVRMGLVDRGAQTLEMRYAGPLSAVCRDPTEGEGESVSLASDSELAAAVRDKHAIFHEGDPAFVVAPLVVRTAPIGVIELSYGGPHSFHGVERAFIEAIAQLCAAAIDREETQSTLQESERAHRFLADAGVALAQSLDEAETLRSVAALTVGTLADCAWVDVARAESDAVARAAFARVDADGGGPLVVEGAPPQFVPGHTCPAYRALHEGVSVVVREIDDETCKKLVDRMPELAGGPPLRSLLVVPLHARGARFGVLTLARSAASPRYDDRDLRFAEEIGRRASVAIDNARLYATARRDRAVAEEASRAKDQFLAVLGHELRNPLAPISTAMRLMSVRARDMCVAERAVVERQVHHMTRLVDDLLDVSRITRGKLELRRRPVEIGEVVARAVETASPALEGNRLLLDVDVPARGLIVNGDVARLSQVFVNLLTNSARYTPSGGRVEIRALGGDRGAREVAISVHDTGIGITADVLPHVFDLFVQGSRPDGVRAGLGLGLAIVRSLVELHGGRVESRSDGAGRGSEFIVHLPLHEADLGVESTHEGENGAGCREPGYRVLVVDDNLDAAETLVEWLRTLGHVARLAADGPTALEAVKDFDPDVALLDIGLPIMDGYEVGRRLRERPGGSHVKLVALTGYGQESDYDRSRRAGFAEHLVKPVDLDAITQAVSFPRSR